MDKLKRYGALILLAVLLLTAALGFPRMLGDYVVQPIAAILWAGWRVIASVDQGVYWLLLIVLCTLLTIRVFSIREFKQPAPEDRHTPLQLTRVEHWRALFEAPRTPEGDATLRASLRGLLTSSLAREGQPPDDDLEEALAKRRISLPAGVQAYLAGSEQDGPGFRLASIARKLRRRLGWSAAEDDSLVDKLLGWMEANMEMNDDR